MKTISKPQPSKTVKVQLSKTGNKRPSEISNTPSSKTGNTMAVIMLTFLSALCLLIFANIGANKEWFKKINFYWSNFMTQKDAELTVEQVKEERWGPAYIISKQIKTLMEQRKVKKPILLFQPNSYLRKEAGYSMPEPIVFYCYTGIQAVWTSSGNVSQATHFVRLTKNKLFIDTISSKVMLQQILNSYKAYPAVL